jgi:hypothetical protein
MSEGKESSSAGTGTAEIPVVRPAASPAGSATGRAGVVAPAPAGSPATSGAEGSTPPDGNVAPGAHATAQGPHATAPVTGRPALRSPRRGPLTVMGPWAPVAGGLLGLLLGMAAVLLLAGSADSFEHRLALAFTVLGLGLLGTAGTLLADEVRMIRQQARDAVVRPAWVEATAGLLNGLTPARLLLLASAFVLFLAAYVSR